MYQQLLAIFSHGEAPTWAPNKLEPSAWRSKPTPDWQGLHRHHFDAAVKQVVVDVGCRIDRAPERPSFHADLSRDEWTGRDGEGSQASLFLPPL